MTRALSNLLLHSTSTSFVLQPVGADAGEKCLVIDREDGKVSFQGEERPRTRTIFRDLPP